MKPVQIFSQHMLFTMVMMTLIRQPSSTLSLQQNSTTDVLFANSNTTTAASCSSPTSVQQTCSNDSQKSSILRHVPTIALHNGIQMPLLQLGTAQLVSKVGIDSTVPQRFAGMVPERSYRQMELALQNNIRAFDTALIYRSHIPMGHVFGEWFRTGQLQSRNDVWIQTKIFHPNATQVTFGSSHMPNLQQMTPDQVKQLTLEHFELSLVQLNIGYVDLLLLHWPSGIREENDDDNNNNNNVDDTIIDWSLNNEYNNRQRRIAAWRVLEQIYAKGWARAIGYPIFQSNIWNN